MLTYANKKELLAKKLWNSEIIKRAMTELNERTVISMHNRLLRHIDEVARKAIENGDSSFIVFGILFGNEGKLPKGDYDYLWNKAIEVFGDTHYAKMFLGTLQMHAFASSEYHWIVVEDEDKRKKKDQNKVPDANQFFLHRPTPIAQGSTNAEIIRRPATLGNSIEDLKRKFNSGKC